MCWSDLWYRVWPAINAYPIRQQQASAAESSSLDGAMWLSALHWRSTTLISVLQLAVAAGGLLLYDVREELAHHKLFSYATSSWLSD
jgi:hypothetical protein